MLRLLLWGAMLLRGGPVVRPRPSGNRDQQNTAVSKNCGENRYWTILRAGKFIILWFPMVSKTKESKS